MVATTGLVGLRPSPTSVARLTSPPYDVVKRGTPLEARLRDEQDSFYHVILGEDPAAALDALQARGVLVADDEPAYYVYEQRWDGGRRLGVFAAVAVSDYASGAVRRHEKTFDDKVQGRIALTRSTGYTTGPVFLLTRATLAPALEAVCVPAPLYEFTSDFAGGTDLHGITNRIWRVSAASPAGEIIAGALGAEDTYIADGHHRYHAALKGGQTHALAYITDGARILAYDRLCTGTRPFAEVRDQLPLEPAKEFATPAKHAFCLYSDGQAWTLRAQKVPEDVVGRLDCSILERELYPRLGLSHDMIMDPAHFDYYSELDLATMRQRVDAGDYDLAVALHPVDVDELMAVADAGLVDSEVVMPEKSTFFSPKILSGLIAYRHSYRD